MWYTEIHKEGRRMVFLNPAFSREDIERKLSQFGYDKEYIETIVDGVHLEKPLTMRCWDDERGTINTENPYRTFYISWGDKITVFPDTSFDIKHRNFCLEFLYNTKVMMYNVRWAFNKFVLRNPWYI